MNSAKPYPQLCLCFLNKISIYRRFHQLKHLQIPPKKRVLSNFIASWFWCFADCGQQLWLSATFKIKKVDPSALHLFLFRESQGEIQCSPDATGWRFGTRFLFSYFGAAPENFRRAVVIRWGANNGGHPLFLVGVPERLSLTTCKRMICFLNFLGSGMAVI